MIQAQQVVSFSPVWRENISIPDHLSVLGSVAHKVTGLSQPRTRPAHARVVKAWHTSVLSCAV